MTPTLIDRVTVVPSETAAQRLRGSTAAVRATIRWFGVRKTLTREQKSQGAESFGAEGDFLSAAAAILVSEERR
jgi:hypothetical protein